MSKSNYPVSQLGHPYSGTSMWIGEFCNSPKILKNIDEPLEVGAAIVAVPIMFAWSVIDTSLSFVADTIILPIDLLSQPEYERITIEQGCDYSRNYPENYKGPIPDKINVNN